MRASGGLCLPGWIINCGKPRRLCREGDYPQAGRLARQILREHPSSSRALLIAGQAEAQMHHSEEALRFSKASKTTAVSKASSPCNGRADRLMKLGRLSEAERHWKRVLELAPQHLPARERLAELLSLEGRNWEAQPHLLMLIRCGRFNGDHLMMLGSTESVFQSDKPQYLDGLPAGGAGRSAAPVGEGPHGPVAQSKCGSEGGAAKNRGGRSLSVRSASVGSAGFSRNRRLPGISPVGAGFALR